MTLETSPPVLTRRPPERLWRDWRVLTGGIVLLSATVVALLGSVVVPFDPHEIAVGEPLIGPSSSHWLGTDVFGRDVLSRLVAGLRLSLGVSTIVAATSLAIGIPLGLFVGYVGGAVDQVVGRVIDFLFAFPAILLALVLTTVLGPSLRTATFALVVIYIPVAARLARSLAIAGRSTEYVEAARIAGASRLRILSSHIGLNSLSPLLVLATSVMAFAILAEAALSFLGVGAQPPAASLGKMLADSSDYLFVQPALVLGPGLAISILVLALNVAGDGLRDALDPNLSATAGTME